MNKEKPSMTAIKKSEWLEITQTELANKKKESADYKETYMIHLNPFDNGGESLVISIHVYDNGDNKIGLNPYYFNTELSAQCYGVHSLEFLMTDGFSPRNIQDIGVFLIGLAEQYSKDSYRG